MTGYLESCDTERTIICLQKWLCMTLRKSFDWIELGKRGLDTCASCGFSDRCRKSHFYPIFYTRGVDFSYFYARGVDFSYFYARGVADLALLPHPRSSRFGSFATPATGAEVPPFRHRDRCRNATFPTPAEQQIWLSSTPATGAETATFTSATGAETATFTPAD